MSYFYDPEGIAYLILVAVVLALFVKAMAYEAKVSKCYPFQYPCDKLRDKLQEEESQLRE